MEPSDMATEIQADRERSRVYRISVDQYLEMIRTGVIPESARIELLGGQLVEQMTKYPPHNLVVGRLGRMLARILPAPWFVSEEKPVKLGRFWYPEPDLAIVRGPDHRFEMKSPEAVDLAFLIEVSESSYQQDRGRKWRLYASAGVSCYWIVNLLQRRIEVHGDPSGQGRSAIYRQAEIYVEGQAIPVVIEGEQVGQILVSEVLPGV
jgi:Uma2 family endonuclease